MTIPWTQIVVIGGEALRALHHITMVVVITCKSNASSFISIRPFGSPLRSWMTRVHVPSLSGPSILDERISPSDSTLPGVVTYIGVRFLRS